MNPERVVLDPEDTPTEWYNILPDLPEPLPPYKRVKDGVEVRTLPPVFTGTVSRLEFSDRRWIEIPSEVRDAYIRTGRPTTLVRARRLEEHLKTGARIYYKCEDLHPVGTFKTNTALAQAYWAREEGYDRTVFAASSGTRTKMAHAYAALYFGLTPTVFMSRGDAENNPQHSKYLSEMLGADLVLSPSSRTEAGRKALSENSATMGTVREELHEEASKPDAVAVISSFLNHVLLTQTVIGLEAEKQISMMDEEPDTVIAPVGGGSNFHGFAAPFIRKRLQGDPVKLLAVESGTTAKLTHSSYRYVRLQSPASDLLGKTYEFEMETPRPGIMGVGIQTTNTAPLLAYLRNKGVIDTRVYPRDERAIFEAARIFLRTEGRLIAPESAYTVRAAIDEALEAKRSGEEPVIMLSISATTYMDFGEKLRYMRFMG